MKRRTRAKPYVKHCTVCSKSFIKKPYRSDVSWGFQETDDDQYCLTVLTYCSKFCYNIRQLRGIRFSE